MGVYSELLQRVAQGSNFNVDFERRNMKVGHQYLIKDGTPIKEIDIDRNENPYQTIQSLYDSYIVSVPTKRSQHRSYFKALAEEELTIAQMCVGEEREYARAKLEGYILCAIINGDLTWLNDKHWYWHGNNGLVIFRKWIER